MDKISERRLRIMEFLRREAGERHHTHEEDSVQYELLKAGDADGASAETRKMLASGLAGHLSDDPLRDAKYLFVAGAALASRAAISAGVKPSSSLSSRIRPAISWILKSNPVICSIW